MPASLYELVWWILTSLVLGLTGVTTFFLKRLVERVDHVAGTLDGIKDKLTADIHGLDMRLIQLETKCATLPHHCHKRHDDV